MLRIDFYVQHLVRHKADAVILASGAPVKFAFPSGERQSKQSIDHAQIIQMVKEAAPPRAITELEGAGRTRFQHTGQGIEVTVFVEAMNARTWKVRIAPARGGAGAAAPAPAAQRQPPAAAPAAAPAAQSLGGGDDFGVGLGAPSAADEPIIERTALTEEVVQAPRVQMASGEPRVNEFLRMMVAQGASDLHLSSGVKPMWRKDGSMQKIGDRPEFSAEELSSLLGEITPERFVQEFDDNWDVDFAHTIEGCARFRVNYFVDRKGPGAVFRQIPFEILGWEKLGIPKGVIDLCYLTKGLVVVTGPTGSGKSTTLASLIDFINDHRTDHIITIEDPIEFVHPNKKCLVNQREVGTHTRGFKQALRAALREDPDIVLVGEMRDLETIAIAIETAETGHLVFGTLHTTSAKSTVDRIIDQFPPDRQEQIRIMLSESLRGVIAQVLCKKKGGGRVAAYEIMLTNPAVSNLIREGKTFQLTSVLQTGKRLGMQTMNDHLLSLVQSGVVEPTEAYLKTNDKTALKESLAKLNIQLDV
jgi:twitching motility protein PilT